MLVTLALVLCGFVQAAEDLVSGPQKDDKLPALNVLASEGEHAGKSVNLLETRGKKPILLVFFSQKTRPTFGLMKQLDAYGQIRQPEGLETIIIHSWAKSEETLPFCKLMREKYGFQGVLAVVAEGNSPPEYNLHSDAAITVVLADKEHKVLLNLSRRDPNRTDFDPVRKAIDDLLGPSPVKFP